MTGDPYEEGYIDGVEGSHDNPYVELSLDWVEYEQGYDDGSIFGRDG